MSFTGDLEHLPIVDILQLLHATRKSGILRINCRKGESHLVFKDGYIVSANHLNNRVRIGDILVKRGAISPEILEKALREQEDVGTRRKPLIVTLLDKGLVNEEEAYRGLEELIELTVVEVLNWKRGTFVLDVETGQATDGYRYYPAKIDREINVDTQGVLMDSLRIFDEKVRDGELAEEDFSDEDDLAPAPETTSVARSLTADDLGLADLEHLDRKIPEVFTGLADQDPARAHRQKLQESGVLLSPENLEKLVAFLGNFPTEAENRMPDDRHSGVMVFFSPDPVLQHAVTTVCKNAGIPVFATDDTLDLEPIIDRSLAKNSLPLLVIDAPDLPDGSFSPEAAALLRRQKKEKYPQIGMIQLSSAQDEEFILQSYDDGVRAVLPRPARNAAAETFIPEIIRFLPTFRSYIMNCVDQQHQHPSAAAVRLYLDELKSAREVPEAALAVLKLTARIFERTLTLVVHGNELVAEKGIGIKAGSDRTPIPSSGFRIPLEEASLFRTVLDTGRIYYGRSGDEGVKDRLHTVIGAPLRSSVMLLPLRMRGHTIALTYGDFGSGEISRVDMDLFHTVATQAELVLENVALRKKLEKPPVRG